MFDTNRHPLGLDPAKPVFGEDPVENRPDLQLLADQGRAMQREARRANGKPLLSDESVIAIASESKGPVLSWLKSVSKELTGQLADLVERGCIKLNLDPGVSLEDGMRVLATGFFPQDENRARLLRAAVLTRSISCPPPTELLRRLRALNDARSAQAHSRVQAGPSRLSDAGTRQDPRGSSRGRKPLRKARAAAWGSRKSWLGDLGK